MTLKEVFEEDLKLIAKSIEENINGLRTVTFNTVKGEMSRRIFQQGAATDGSPIGQYTASSKKTRERGKRHTERVDLEMTGELRRSLVVGEDGRNVVMGFVENTEPKISIKGGVVKVTGKTDFLVTDNAIKQEKNFGKEIFAPTEKEVETGEEVFLKEVDKLIKKTLGNKKIRIKN